MNSAIEEMLTEKFAATDYDNVRKDVMPFVKDSRELDIWNREFFISITMQNLK